MASRTAVPHGFERGIFGGIRPGNIDPTTLSPVEHTLQDASDRVTSGWLASREIHDAALRRRHGDHPRVVGWLARSPCRRGAVVSERTNGNRSADAGPAGRRGATATPASPVADLPSSDQLTMGLRVAMETVDRSSGSLAGNSIYRSERSTHARGDRSWYNAHQRANQQERATALDRHSWRSMPRRRSSRFHVPATSPVRREALP